MKKNVLLTGSTGLIGSAVLKRFIHSGWEVSTLVHQQSSSASQIRNIPYDPQKDVLSDVLKDIEPPHVIVHNAGSKLLGLNEEEVNILNIVNVNFSKDLLKYATDHGVAKFIFSSTLSGVKKPLPKPITEECELEPIYFYSTSKYLVEEEMKRASQEHPLKTYSFRITSPVPERYENLPSTVLKYWIDLAKSKQDLPLQAGGMRFQNFISAQDIARVFEHAAAFEEESGIYNLGSTSGIYFHELAQMISEKWKVGIIPIEGEEQEYWDVSIKKLNSNFGKLISSDSKEAIARLLTNIEV